MKAEEILAQPAKVLSQKQREFYFASGYLLMPEFVSAEWLNRLQTVTGKFVDESRTVTASNDRFVLESGHSAAWRAQSKTLERCTACWLQAVVLGAHARRQNICALESAGPSIG